MTPRRKTAAHASRARVREVARGAQMSGFGIYVHWPYCAAICPYCDFNVYRARGADNAPLLAAIVADMAAHAQRFGKREAASLFFGGGTPSLLRGDEIARLIDAASQRVRARAPIARSRSKPIRRMRALLRRTGRRRRQPLLHRRAGARRCGAEGARPQARCGVRAARRRSRRRRPAQRVSLDLIYAREGQGVEAWRGELRRALALPVEHVSLYQLTIEPETAFARRVARGQLTPPDNDAAAALYEATQEVCDAAGFPAYEISNHARGAAARSRHNLIYWRSDDWIGVGPGAHGRITHDGARIALEAQRRPSGLHRRGARERRRLDRAKRAHRRGNRRRNAAHGPAHRRRRRSRAHRSAARRAAQRRRAGMAAGAGLGRARRRPRAPDARAAARSPTRSR